MDIGLAVPRLHPTGGLEKHALRVAAALLARHHRVTVYSSTGLDLVPAGAQAVKVESRSWSNHGAIAAFARRLAEVARGRHDILVGFKKMPGLDALLCADWRFAEDRSWLVRQLPRYRAFAALERACFAPDSETRTIILLSEPQRQAYAETYGTPPERMHVLPPTIDRAHSVATLPTVEERTALRAAHGVPDGRPVWLWVGLQPKVKGLDRVIPALAKHPEALLLVCGAAAGQKRYDALVGEAKTLGIADRIRALGMLPEDRLRELFRLSDLLVHPARLDVTATVILEAMASGLPVISTAVCGYSVHVAAANAGIVLPMPFEQAALERALATATPEQLRLWAENALKYCANPDLYTGIERACDLIEAAVRTKPQ